MTDHAPEIEWLFATIDDVVGGSPLAWGRAGDDAIDVDAGDVPVRRVDRNESAVYQQPAIRSRRGDLQASCFVGAALEERPTSPAGTDEYRAEAIVTVRIEALHASEWGFIDSSGEDGIPFGDLYGPIRSALRDGRGYPDVGREDVGYQTALLENETDRSSDHRDFYDYRFDVRFRGFESGEGT